MLKETPRHLFIFWTSAPGVKKQNIHLFELGICSLKLSIYHYQPYNQLPTMFKLTVLLP